MPGLAAGFSGEWEWMGLGRVKVAAGLQSGGRYQPVGGHLSLLAPVRGRPCVSHGAFLRDRVVEPVPFYRGHGYWFEGLGDVLFAE